MTKNELLSLSFEFAMMIITYSEILEKERKFTISQQLLKSGTSIGANVNEAQSAESRRDFIHKLCIARKEVYETEYWLLLCQKASSYRNPPDQLFEMLLSMKKLLNAIIYSSRSKNKNI